MTFEPDSNSPSSVALSTSGRLNSSEYNSAVSKCIVFVNTWIGPVKRQKVCFVAFCFLTAGNLGVPLRLLRQKMSGYHKFWVTDKVERHCRPVVDVPVSGGTLFCIDGAWNWDRNESGVDAEGILRTVAFFNIPSGWIQARPE